MESLQKKGITVGDRNRIKPLSMPMSVCCQPRFPDWNKELMFILTHHSMPLDVFPTSVCIICLLQSGSTKPTAFPAAEGTYALAAAATSMDYEVVTGSAFACVSTYAYAKSSDSISLPSLHNLSDSKLLDITRFYNNSFPDINMGYEVVMEGGNNIILIVTLEKDIEERKTEAKELEGHGWWVVVGDTETNSLLVIKKVVLVVQRKLKKKLQFSAPDEADAFGKKSSYKFQRTVPMGKKKKTEEAKDRCQSHFKIQRFIKSNFISILFFFLILFFSCISGVEKFATDMNKHKVVVMGKFDPQKVLKKLKKKTGKKVEIVVDHKGEDVQKDGSNYEGDLAMEGRDYVKAVDNHPFWIDYCKEMELLMMFSDENPNACLIM
ncbi:hypothetical protein FEM48_Zijuj07G0140000 [Ziziphus jujuba var. spinosa]|uniref:SEC63 domain-containing protein n=1 Tax=Ziziphus jujuba var. spinosa TaxID=714518 RepID=A0A978V521_ZIZJJ|nr:hypothetical protein FEM48_Zijuj07G0140000 [Ziziphus jujuba var. spinosa]